MFLGWKSYLAT